MTQKTAIALNARTFAPVQNSEGGVVDDRTAFHFRQDGDTFTADYCGGDIRKGHIVGEFTDETKARLLYHCMTNDGQLKAGRADAGFTTTDDGRVTMALEWAWVSGADGAGTSTYAEVVDKGKPQ